MITYTVMSIARNMVMLIVLGVPCTEGMVVELPWMPIGKVSTWTVDEGCVLQYKTVDAPEWAKNWHPYEKNYMKRNGIVLKYREE